MDFLCEQFSSKISFNDNLSKIIKDIITILNEIANKNTLDVDIYDICVETGNDLTWDIDYVVYKRDHDWLKSEEGESYLAIYFNSIYRIENYEEFKRIYNDIVYLFSLQITPG